MNIHGAYKLEEVFERNPNISSTVFLKVLKERNISTPAIDSIQERARVQLYNILKNNPNSSLAWEKVPEMLAKIKTDKYGYDTYTREEVLNHFSAEIMWKWFHIEDFESFSDDEKVEQIRDIFKEELHTRISREDVLACVQRYEDALEAVAWQHSSIEIDKLREKVIYFIGCKLHGESVDIDFCNVSDTSQLIGHIEKCADALEAGEANIVREQTNSLQEELKEEGIIIEEEKIEDKAHTQPRWFGGFKKAKNIIKKWWNWLKNN